MPTSAWPPTMACVGQILVVQDDELDIDAALLGALDRRQRLDGFDAGQVAEGDPHVAGICGRRGHRGAHEGGEGGCQDRTS